MSEAECYTNQKYYLFIFCGVKMLYNCCIVDFGILCLFINDDLKIPLRSQCNDPARYETRLNLELPVTCVRVRAIGRFEDRIGCDQIEETCNVDANNIIAEFSQ
jgi:hypothetical protein